MSEVVQTQDLAFLEEVIKKAEERWGTEFDDANTLNDWVAYIIIYAARAATMENKTDSETQYDALVKVAGLALTAAARVRQAAIQPRHYDDWPPTPKPFFPDEHTS